MSASRNGHQHRYDKLSCIYIIHIQTPRYEIEVNNVWEQQCICYSCNGTPNFKSKAYILMIFPSIPWAKFLNTELTRSHCDDICWAYLLDKTCWMLSLFEYLSYCISIYTLMHTHDIIHSICKLQSNIIL